MPPLIHDILAHIYHLGQRILFTPLWRSPLAAVAAALILRLALRRRAVMAAPLAVLVGWVVLNLPAFALVPTDPVQRLPGAALIVTLYVFIAGPARGRAGALVLFALGVVLAWWLRGAPLGGAPLANTVPWALGMWAALAVARRVSVKDQGPATLAAAAALACALFLSGASAHWWRAAAVPGWVGLGLIGVPEAVPALTMALVAAGMAAISASDRGRFIPADLAVTAPFLVWGLAPHLLPRLNRAGPALAAALAGMAVVAGLFGLTALLGLR